MPPGPGCRECTSPRPEPGGVPLALRLSEGLGSGALLNEEMWARHGFVTLVGNHDRFPLRAEDRDSPCLEAAARVALDQTKWLLAKAAQLTDLTTAQPQRGSASNPRSGSSSLCLEVNDARRSWSSFVRRPWHPRRVCGAIFRSGAHVSWTTAISGEAASWLFSPRRMALILFAYRQMAIPLPNVRVKRATTAGRQARAGENVPRTARPGLVACRWRSA